MMDRTLRTILMIILPLGGIIILTFTWLRPLPGTERILNTLIGLVSIAAVLLRPMLFKILHYGEDTEQSTVKAEAKEIRLYPRITGQ